MAKKVVSVRIKDETDLLLKKLATFKNETQAYVVDEAIKGLAKKEKINTGSFDVKTLISEKEYLEKKYKVKLVIVEYV